MVDFLVRHTLCKFMSTWIAPNARSCLTNMLCFCHKVNRRRNTSIYYLLRFAQKAFDKVPHILLLLQLKAHDIGEDIIDLIEQWLCTRWRGFKLEISLEWGTTMVSIKAFIILNIYIYINDFDDNITSNVLKCAPVHKHV